MLPCTHRDDDERKAPAELKGFSPGSLAQSGGWRGGSVLAGAGCVLRGSHGQLGSEEAELALGSL